jgi:plastocyanin
VRRLPVLLVAFAALAAAPPALADETIALVPGSSGFRPNSVTIRAGERVVWRNDDQVPRRVVGDRDEFSTQLLKPGESAVVRFDAVTTVGFHDARRPELRGAVVVVVPPHSVTLRASATRVASGTVVRFSGRISPARAGEVIQLLRISGANVDILDSTVTRRDGRWSIGTTVTAPAIYRVRWERTHSRAVRIRLR